MPHAFLFCATSTIVAPSVPPGACRARYTPRGRGLHFCHGGPLDLSSSVTLRSRRFAGRSRRRT
eukprot:2831336-Pyramimonas_sp.AAC.1